MVIKAKEVYIEIFIKTLTFFLIVFFSNTNSGNITQPRLSELKILSIKLKASLLDLPETLDDFEDGFQEEVEVSQDEKVLQEIYVVGNLIYQKTIELIVIYYCTELEVLYDQSLLEISKHTIHLLQLLLKYIPLVYSDPKISTFVKIRKISYAASVVAASALWMRAFWLYQKDKHSS